MDFIRRRWNGEQSDSAVTNASLVNGAEDSLDYGNQPEGLLEYIPIRFLENRIQALSRTSVPHDLGRLQQHRDNMEKFRENSEWNRLHTEQINASRTVQQLRGHLETLDELRQQVTPSDIAAFDEVTDSVRTEILAAVEDYQRVTMRMDYVAGDERDGRGEEEEEEVDGEGRKTDGQWLLVADRNADHYQSLEDLRNELEELNGLVRQLNTAVHDHSRNVARVNSRAENTAFSVRGGIANLRGGQKLKAYVLPLGGAIVGGVLGGFLGGPIGAIAGVKVGAITAATVGTAGVVGGALIGYQVNKTQSNAEVEEEIAREDQESKKDK